MAAKQTRELSILHPTRTANQLPNPERDLEGDVPSTPVVRRYRPEPEALDSLVELLYQLLIEVPGTPRESACLPKPPE